MVEDTQKRYADDVTVQELVRLRVENERLREALNDVLPHVVTQTVSCGGDKCREPICTSCNIYEDAEEAATIALVAVKKARSALQQKESK